MITHSKKIHADTSALLVIDIQERFAPAIDNFDLLVSSTVQAVQGACILDIPVLITEQYPRGLGRTVENIRSVSSDIRYFEKTTFSALGSEELRTWLENSPVKQLVIAGLETHVCVAQTAVDLRACGYEVFILENCLSSRTRENKENGIARMKSAGAIPYTTESFLFEGLGSCTHPRFKDISQLVK